MSTPAVELRHITKRFPGVVANDDVDLTVERLPDGEVSSFLHDEVVVGDELEVRGPIGGWFVWRGDGPALLVASNRPVLALSGVEEAHPTALVGLARQEVEQVVSGLERGTVLLTHVPSP